MSIYIASDHGGFKLKQELLEFLKSFHLEINDLGPSNFSAEDDYTDYAFPLAAKVAANKENKGILICRNGVGVCIAANKISGIRAGISWNIKHAEMSRLDDNTNILCLPADYISIEDAKKICSVWLATEFSNEERHVRRLNKIKNFEENE